MGEFWGFFHSILRIVFNLLYNGVCIIVCISHHAAIFADLFSMYFVGLVSLSTWGRIGIILCFEIVVVAINLYIYYQCMFLTMPE